MQTPQAIKYGIAKKAFEQAYEENYYATDDVALVERIGGKVKVIENKAHLFCYGTAKHFLKNDSGKNVWTVVGTYDIDLMKEEKNWVIHSLKFNFKYTSGNEDLPGMAQKNLN